MKFAISYRDESVRDIEADSYSAEGMWLHFYGPEREDGNVATVFMVAVDLVESVESMEADAET